MSPDVYRLYNFLDKVYELAAAGEEEDAGDEIFDVIDRLCHAEWWDLIDRILEEVDVCRLTTSLMCSFLAITSCVHTHLKSRSDYYDRVYIRMTELKGAEYTERVLGRFR